MVGQEPGTAGYLGSLSVDRAHNWTEFRDVFEVNDAKDRISLSAHSAAVQSHLRKFATIGDRLPKGPSL